MGVQHGPLYAQSANSDWVKREFGAAWALNKLITPILLNLDISDLPPWLNSRQACWIQDIEEIYITELRDR